MLSSSAALRIPVAPSVLFLWCQRSRVMRHSSDISQRPHNPNELFIQPLLPINTTVLTEPYQYSGISSRNTHKKVILQMCSSFSHPEWKQKQPSQDSFTSVDTTCFSPPLSNKIWKCWPQSSFQSLLFFTETMLVGSHPSVPLKLLSSRSKTIFRLPIRSHCNDHTADHCLLFKSHSSLAFPNTILSWIYLQLFRLSINFPFIFSSSY